MEMGKARAACNTDREGPHRRHGWGPWVGGEHPWCCYQSTVRGPVRCVCAGDGDAVRGPVLMGSESHRLVLAMRSHFRKKPTTSCVAAVAPVHLKSTAAS